jgi:ribose transport system substrate-binding protein
MKEIVQPVSKEKHMRKKKLALQLAAIASVATLGLAGCAAGDDSSSGDTYKIAYLSYAVANSYDSPMLAAAQAVAGENNAEVTVFDANNDPNLQYQQLQDVISSGQYDGIITQPIFGTGLVDLVSEAIDAGIKVVNMDQILGPDLTTFEPQVEGLSGNVTFVPTELGLKLGEQVVDACMALELDPCNVGYMYNIKASSLDVALTEAFTEAIAGSNVKVVAEGEGFFTPAVALGAVQNMLQANPEINLIAGSDQSIQGATQAIDGAGLTGKIALVGFGGSAVAVSSVASGAWFADVAQAPATTGSLAMKALIAALRDGTVTGGVNPLADLPNNGIITKESASKFTGEWLG